MSTGKLQRLEFFRDYKDAQMREKNSHRIKKPPRMSKVPQQRRMTWVASSRLNLTPQRKFSECHNKSFRRLRKGLRRKIKNQEAPAYSGLHCRNFLSVVTEANVYDDYQFKELIQEGGYGTVWLARRHHDNRAVGPYVAIKRIAKGSSFNASIIDQSVIRVPPRHVPTPNSRALQKQPLDELRKLASLYENHRLESNAIESVDHYQPDFFNVSKQEYWELSNTPCGVATEPTSACSRGSVYKTNGVSTRDLDTELLQVETLSDCKYPVEFSSKEPSLQSRCRPSSITSRETAATISHSHVTPISKEVRTNTISYITDSIEMDEDVQLNARSVKSLVKSQRVSLSVKPSVQLESQEFRSSNKDGCAYYPCPSSHLDTLSFAVLLNSNNTNHDDSYYFFRKSLTVNPNSFDVVKANSPERFLSPKFYQLKGSCTNKRSVPINRLPGTNSKRCISYSSLCRPVSAQSIRALDVMGYKTFLSDLTNMKHSQTTNLNVTEFGNVNLRSNKLDLNKPRSKSNSYDSGQSFKQEVLSSDSCTVSQCNLAFNARDFSQRTFSAHNKRITMSGEIPRTKLSVINQDFMYSRTNILTNRNDLIPTSYDYKLSRSVQTLGHRQQQSSERRPKFLSSMDFLLNTGQQRNISEHRVSTTGSSVDQSCNEVNISRNSSTCFINKSIRILPDAFLAITPRVLDLTDEVLVDSPNSGKKSWAVGSSFKKSHTSCRKSQVRFGNTEYSSTFVDYQDVSAQDSSPSSRSNSVYSEIYDSFDKSSYLTADLSTYFIPGLPDVYSERIKNMNNDRALPRDSQSSNIQKNYVACNLNIEGFGPDISSASDSNLCNNSFKNTVDNSPCESIVNQLITKSVPISNRLSGTFAKKEDLYQGIQSRNARSVNDAISSEIQILKKLDHPNICRLKMVYHDASAWWLITEYCAGSDLYDLIIVKRISLKPKVMRNICIQLAAAIRFCHGCNVAHRDIKLENIMLYENNPEYLDRPTVKLIDFGISKIISEENTEVYSKNQCSDVYKSPELLMSVSHDESNSSMYFTSDIWATGVSIYYILTGTAPFIKGPNLYSDILEGKMVTDNTKFLESSPDAQDLVKALLTVDSNMRPDAFQMYRSAWLARSNNTRIWKCEKPHIEPCCEKLRPSSSLEAELSCLKQEQYWNQHHENRIIPRRTSNLLKVTNITGLLAQDHANMLKKVSRPLPINQGTKVSEIFSMIKYVKKNSYPILTNQKTAPKITLTSNNINTCQSNSMKLKVNCKRSEDPCTMNIEKESNIDIHLLSSRRVKLKRSTDDEIRKLHMDYADIEDICSFTGSVDASELNTPNICFYNLKDHNVLPQNCPFHNDLTLVLPYNCSAADQSTNSNALRCQLVKDAFSDIASEIKPSSIITRTDIVSILKTKLSNNITTNIAKKFSELFTKMGEGNKYVSKIRSVKNNLTNSKGKINLLQNVNRIDNAKSVDHVNNFLARLSYNSQKFTSGEANKMVIDCFMEQNSNFHLSNKENTEHVSEGENSLIKRILHMNIRDKSTRALEASKKRLFYREESKYYRLCQERLSNSYNSAQTLRDGNIRNGLQAFSNLRERVNCALASTKNKILMVKKKRYHSLLSNQRSIMISNNLIKNSILQHRNKSLSLISYSKNIWKSEVTGQFFVEESKECSNNKNNKIFCLENILSRKVDNSNKKKFNYDQINHEIKTRKKNISDISSDDKSKNNEPKLSLGFPMSSVLNSPLVSSKHSLNPSDTYLMSKPMVNIGIQNNSYINEFFQSEITKKLSLSNINEQFYNFSNRDPLKNEPSSFEKNKQGLDKNSSNMTYSKLSQNDPHYSESSFLSFDKSEHGDCTHINPNFLAHSNVCKNRLLGNGFIDFSSNNAKCSTLNAKKNSIICNYLNQKDNSMDYINSIMPNKCKFSVKSTSWRIDFCSNTRCTTCRPWSRDNCNFSNQKHLSIQIRNHLVSAEAFVSANLFRQITLCIIASQLDHVYTANYENTFNAIDYKEDNCICFTEFCHAWEEHVDQLSMPESVRARGSRTSLSTLYSIFQGMDLSGTGKVKYTEYIAAALDSQILFDEDIVRPAFIVFDMDRDGIITLEDFKRVVNVSDICHSVCNDYLDNLWDSLTRSKSGGDKYLDCKQFMCALNGL